MDGSKAGEGRESRAPELGRVSYDHHPARSGGQRSADLADEHVQGDQAVFQRQPVAAEEGDVSGQLTQVGQCERSHRRLVLGEIQPPQGDEVWLLPGPNLFDDLARVGDAGVTLLGWY